MIPNITDSNVKAAISKIDHSGIDNRRVSKKFCLVIDGRHYPPKYVISLAVEDARGLPLSPKEFTAGEETNAILIGLGFTVVACDCGNHSNRQAVTPVKPNNLRPPAANQSSNNNTLIGRIVVQGEISGDPEIAEAILFDLLTRLWPKDKHVKFLITPGGFVRSSWPHEWTGCTSWNSRTADATELIANAESVINHVVTKRVLLAAKDKADVLTIGIDLSAGSGSLHVELVAVFDVQAAKLVRWTGKSYPTGKQERTLVQMVDLETHLLTIAGERVLVLGCHDLNMFSPRGWANMKKNGKRYIRCNAMRQLAKKFKPTVVLQHPHRTDTPKIWKQSWEELLREFGTVKYWASGICYYNKGDKLRAPLEKVLKSTCGGEPTTDIIIDII